MKPDGTLQVMCYVLSDGAYQLAIVDLIFDGEQPFAVLEWGGPANSEHPQVSVPLDRKRLIKCRNGDADYVYDGRFEVPRKPR